MASATFPTRANASTDLRLSPPVSMDPESAMARDEGFVEFVVNDVARRRESASTSASSSRYDSRSGSFVAHSLSCS